ncbi:hypothetical protein PO903_14935 [Paenibacillus sp. PK4536]|uniref:hypothetical protein n=1 Tax=Paenibacillus sp. PK4536 TaxID=3024576 RepID=UPI0023598A4F|nr:hypothetical protein [Paenibacillus sp. PK4536]WIM37940.1 hypothetical protein PO903_14935 [Paenibacillus sp. PK4536]
MTEENKQPETHSEDTLMEKKRKEDGSNIETQADEWTAKPSPKAAGDDDKSNKE